ncbi:norbelladine synthase-like isoform X2 [Quercus robur]|uniref:norbelladine synthase-like isoform X2 n=1 Tax=Quercus robur TaxID=38942 RepID=UPI0021631031|nr:norbelladine synthase-like isoform X2 [Quercus robur]
MSGQLSHELEVNVPASEAWELYGRLGLAKLLVEDGSIVEKIEVIEGDGGIGTILKKTYAPGSHGFTVHKEKFTKLDNEKCMKELKVIEGGYPDLGFTLFRVRFEIIEKDNDSCIIKSTIEYDVKEEAVANTSYANNDLVAKIAEVAKNYLIKNKATENAA